MLWNWELPDWPKFKYDPHAIALREKEFLLRIGSMQAYLRNIDPEERGQFIVEILSSEGLESSKIEGEALDRESLQSSIKKHFGLNANLKKESPKESQMASILLNAYETFADPLTHEMLFQWHAQLFARGSDIETRGKYRTHAEPLQIVTHRMDVSKVYFEAPPSNKVFQEMEKFIHWFNDANASEHILVRASVAHLYFESIHPFEDGNGRIGRVLIEKILSQGVNRPALIAVSKVLEKHRKEYYAALEQCNRTLEVQHFVEFLTRAIIQAQEESMQLLQFIIEKSKMLTALSGRINPRQEAVLLRMFKEGPNGFKGGMSAEKYIAITKTSRATATRDLADLIEKGALLKTGQLRHTRYWLNLKGF